MKTLVESYYPEARYFSKVVEHTNSKQIKIKFMIVCETSPYELIKLNVYLLDNETGLHQIASKYDIPNHDDYDSVTAAEEWIKAVFN